MLREFFISGDYQKFLKSHPKMAGEFATLLTSMWTTRASTTRGYIAPTGFKKALDKHAPMFAGYEHQDAHELLAVVLDGLHEDLNIGAVTGVDDVSTGASTTALQTPSGSAVMSPMSPPRRGESEWMKHRSENTSVIADLFDGQQRIVTECKSCGYQSFCYEPFRYLMLPVPVTEFRQIAVHLVLSQQPTAIRRLVAIVHKSATFQAVVSNLASRYPFLDDGLDWEFGTVFVEVYMSKIHRFIDMSMLVSDFRSEDKIFVYQTNPANGITTAPGLSFDDNMDGGGGGGGGGGGFPIPSCYVQIVHRREMVSKRRHRRTSTRREIFGVPSVFAVNPKWTHQQLFTVIKTQTTGLVVPGGASPTAFTVRLTSPDGSASCCSTMGCGRANCEGCVINPISMRPIGFKGSWLYLAIDWVSMDRYNPSWEIAVDLSPVNPDETMDHSIRQLGGKSSTTKVSATSLYDCLDAYTGTESMVGENRWFCEKCNSRSDAQRRTGFWQSPDVLVVLLKRFQYSASVGFEKISASINFPKRDFSLKSSSYDLYGIVNHYGSLSSGHYTAICREESSGKWFMYNDHQVIPILSENIDKEINNCSKSCYVLFYKRQGSRPANIINYGLND